MDILHDNSRRTLYRIATDHADRIPEYVLDHELSKEAADKLDDTCFADPDQRLFPIDSPAATWLSAAYFAKTAEGSGRSKHLLGAIRTAIEKAAAVYGIEKDVKAAFALPAQEKTASADDAYGWLQHMPDGTVVERLYPMFDERGVKLACEHFEENRNKYPFGMRREIAKNIVKRADSLKTEYSDCVRREAGLGLPCRDTLMVELLERARMSKDAEVSAMLANLNNVIAALPMEELAPELDKLAEVLENADRIEGLQPLYGRKVLAPADFLYDISQKVACELGADSVELDKHVFSLTKLSELDPAIFGTVLGDDFVARIAENGKIKKQALADELYSLPRPDKVALERHLEQSFA